MARIKSIDSSSDTSYEPRLADEIRRFIIYAGDLIEEQRAVSSELIAMRSSLSETSKAYERMSRAIAKREVEGIKINISTDVDNARKQIVQALSEPLARAEGMVRETRLITFLAALTGSVIGAGSIVMLLIFDLA